MKQTTLATLAALGGYTIFGFSSLFTKLALDVTSPFNLLAIRFVLAFLTLNLILLSGRVRLDLKGKPLKMLLMLGLLQPILYFLCENFGIAMTSTSFSGIILGMIPVIGLVMGRLMLGERCTTFQTACAVVSILGVAITSGGGDVSFSPIGIALLFSAAVINCLYSVISRSISEQFTPFERTYVMFALGSAAFVLIALVQNRAAPAAILAPLQVPQFWISVIYLAVVSSVCAFLLLNYSMNYISVAKVSIFANFSTVISVLAGIFIMGDAFSPIQLLGIVIITLSVFGVSMPQKASRF